MSTSVRGTGAPAETAAPPPEAEPAAPPTPTASNDVSAWSPHDAAAFAQAETLLTTDASRLDFLVTQGDARGAFEALSTLSPQDFHQALHALDSEGKLATMLDKLPDADRARFLAVAKEKGSVQQQPAAPVKGPFDPPAEPALYRHDATLPRCVNDLIHEQSQATIAGYKVRYDEYIDRYASGVGSCQSLRDIRALGSPVVPTGTWELNDDHDPHAERYRGDWDLDRSAGSSNRAYLAVSNRMQDLAGERRDGSFWLEAKLDVQLGPWAGSLEATGQPKKDAESRQVGWVTPKQSKDTYATIKRLGGKQEDAVQVKLPKGSAVGGSVTTKDGKLEKVSASVSSPAGPGVGLAADGKTLTVNLTQTKDVLGDLTVKGGSYATGNGSELHGGLQGKLTQGQFLEVKGSIGVGAVGITAATLARLAAKEGVFSLPEELAAHRPWAALSAARRGELAALGWSEDEWKAAS